MKSRVPAPLAKIAVDSGASAGDDWLTVPVARLRETLQALQAEGFTTLAFLTCVDHLARSDGQVPFSGPPDAETPVRFELVYQLRDLEGRRLLRVRTFLADAPDPSAPSVQDLFPPANWDERETWDMFGIRFQGHPGLTRILMPDDWVGHPLRRDFPVGGEPVDFSSDHEQWQTSPPLA